MARESSSEKSKFQAFILEICVKLELSVETTALASVYYHRFSSAPKAETFCQFTVVAVCVYIASRYQEEQIRIRDVINVTYKILHPEKPLLDIGEKKYWEYREGMNRLEFVVLRTLSFDLHVDLPHRYLLHYALSLRGSGINRNQLGVFENAVSHAWQCCFDSFLDPTVPLTFDPKQYAVGILDACLRKEGVKVILSGWQRTLVGDGKEWREVKRVLDL